MEDRKHDAPGDVVAAYIRRSSAEDWVGAAALFTAGFLQWFREVEAPLPPSSPSPQTVDDWIARDPEMPRAVAEYYVRRMKHHPRPELGDVFARVDSEEELEALSNVELYGRYLEASDPRLNLRRHIEALQTKYPEYASQLEGRSTESGRWWDLEVLHATIVRNRGYALVGHAGSERSPDPVEWPPHVVVLRPSGSGWRIAHGLPWHQNMAFGPLEVTGPEGDVIRLQL